MPKVMELSGVLEAKKITTFEKKFGHVYETHSRDSLKLPIP